MSGRAERPRRGSAPRRRGPLFDRAWIGRIALAVVVAVALLLVARVSMMAFSGSGKRMERFERGAERDAAPGPPAAGTLP